MHCRLTHTQTHTDTNRCDVNVAGNVPQCGWLINNAIFLYMISHQNDLIWNFMCIVCGVRLMRICINLKTIAPPYHQGWVAQRWGHSLGPMHLRWHHMSRQSSEAVLRMPVTKVTCLLLVATFHLALEVFARQLLLSGIVPSHVRSRETLTTFCRHLKSHFSTQLYPLPSDPSQCLWFVLDYGAL